MRVVIAGGVVVEHDAISAAIATQSSMLRGMPGIERVTVLAQHVSRPLDGPSGVVHDAWSFLSHPAVVEADVVIAHWGIHASIFDALTVLHASGVRTVVHFHNCTPAEIVPESQRELIERSLAQIAHLISVDLELWTFSPFNVDTLLGLGATRDRLRFVPFPIDVDGGFEPRRPGPLQLLTVGRLVPSKAQDVLLQALALLDDGERDQLRSTIVGSRTFSDTPYVRRLEQLRLELGLSDTVTFVDSPSDTELFDIYRRADVVVSPSLHEGLCVPVIEGYALGCRAIGTSAGNLPHLLVTGDTLVPPGDAVALRDAIRAEIGRGTATELDPRRAEVASRYSRAASVDAHRVALFSPGSELPSPAH